MMKFEDFDKLRKDINRIRNSMGEVDNFNYSVSRYRNHILISCVKFFSMSDTWTFDSSRYADKQKKRTEKIFDSIQKYLSDSNIKYIIKPCDIINAGGSIRIDTEWLVDLLFNINYIIII